MKNILIAGLLLSSTIEMVSGATGERSDDYVVLLVPMVVLLIIWAAYVLRTKLRERNHPEPEPGMETDREENLSRGESTEV